MPKIVLHKNGQIHEGEVKENANLVVRAGIKQFPYPHLSYGCGAGKCARCACIIIEGGEYLPAPNWKEKKMLGDRVQQGYRLACQLWFSHDAELTQDNIDPSLARVGIVGTAALPTERNGHSVAGEEHVRHSDQ